MDSEQKNSDLRELESNKQKNKHTSLRNNGILNDNAADSRIFPGEIHLEEINEANISNTHNEKKRNNEKIAENIDWNLYKKKYEEKIKATNEEKVIF